MKKFLVLIVMALSFVSCDKSEVTNDGLGMVVQPSWREAFHYANKAESSQVPWTYAGIALIVIGILLLIFVAVKFSRPGAVIAGIFFICFGGGLGCLLGKPNAVRIDNVKTVDKAYYDRVGQKHILDSLFETNHMSSAAKY